MSCSFFVSFCQIDGELKISITIIGAGKVGSVLAKAFFQAGLTIDKIISKSAVSAESLAKLTNSEWGSDVACDISSDYIILTVPDNEIETVCGSLGNITNSTLVHTAGSFGINAFEFLKCRGKGVLYPLQTFSPDREIDLGVVPFLIEGDSSDTEDNLDQLACLISDRVFRLGTEDRKMIHLSAVFVCNFVNHILLSGEQLTGKTGVPFSILEPLIDETFSKAKEIGPKAAQTGPAIRNDVTTIEKHIDLLSFSPELRDIYKAITRSIIRNNPS